jgi:hypothetical protein
VTAGCGRHPVPAVSAWRRALLGALLAGLVFVVGWPSVADAVPTAPEAPDAPVAPAQSEEECTWSERMKILEEDGVRKVETTFEVSCPPGVPKPGRTESAYPPLPAGREDCELARTGTHNQRRYRVECGSQTWAEKSWPEDYHPCSWVMTTNDDESRSVRLECPTSVYEPTDQELMPPLPAGCRWEDGTRGRRQVTACADVGQLDVDCRNEKDWWFDDHQTKQVPENAPQWWLDEIEAESGVDQGQGCKLADHPPYLPCAERELGSYTAPGLLPDQCWGTYPTSHYELSWDDGSWTDVSKYGERLMGWVASFLFTIGRSSIQIVLWLVQWGFEFDISEYTEITSSVGGNYQNRIVGPWGLDDIVWMVLIGYAGMATLRRRFGAAGGEILISFVMLGLATVMFDQRAMYMDAVAEAMTKGSDELLIAATDTPSTVITDQRSQVIRPLQKEIHDQFVEEPYMYLNWGTSNMPDSCREIVLNIAATGWDGDGWPARYMGREGNDDACQDLAGTNAEMNGTRLASALLTMIVSLVVAVVLGLAAVTVLLAKFMVGVLFALAPFVVVIAVLPGSGRRLAWTWLGAGAQAFAVAWGMSFAIALMLLATKEFLDSSRDMEIYERWGLVLMVVCIAYVGRKRLVASTQAFAGHVADAMTRLAPASANWSGSGPVGVDYGRADRTAGRAAQVGAIATAAPLALAGRSVAQRWQERRTARRSLRNMRYMERQRMRPQHEYRVDTYQYARRAPAGTPAKATYTPGGPQPKPGLLSRVTGRGGGGGGGGPSVTLTAPTGGGVQDGEMRERWEMVAKVQAPPSFARHPIRHMQDRMANRGIMRSARRQAREINETPYAPDYHVDRGMPHTSARPATAPPRPVPTGRRWVPRSVRGRTLRQNAARVRVPRGWR